MAERLLPEMMLLVRAAPLTALWPVATALTSVAVAACGGNGVDALAATETGPGVLELTTTCAGELSVEVEETPNEVRISGVDGDSIGGDCLGVVEIELAEPLGGRDVVVDGARWVDLPAICPWGSIGPRDLGDRLESCSTPGP